MAVESCFARASGLVSEATLRLRQPARRFAGSVRSAVTKGAVICGTYCLLIGSIISWRPWGYREMSGVIQASAGFAFITAIVDIAIIFSVLVRDDKILKYTICASMAVYMVALPLGLCNILGVLISGNFDIPLWETPRFVICLVHLGLMYCLLAELRGDPLPPMDTSPPPPPEAGWLKNNLARTGPPPPAADDALLKLQVEQNNLGGGGGPAVFAPSSCTTAAPVHSVYSPVQANTPVSGPVSSSEA